MTYQETQRRPDGATVDDSCVDDAETRLMRAMHRDAPTALDGLDLTVAEACALPPETFRRAFGVSVLGDVPAVGPGCLPRAPRGCGHYVRWRPAPKKPGPKDRKAGAWELVVASPVRAEPEAGGGIAVAPSRIVLRAATPDEARLEALVLLARRAGRRLRATSWAVERVQALLAADVLARYDQVYLADVGAVPSVGPRDPRLNERPRVAAFRKAFPDLAIGDVGDWIPKAYERLTPGRSPQTRHRDLYAAKRGMRLGLQLLGVPPTYQLDFKIKDPGMLDKVPWTPAELDRLRAAADGYVFEPDGTPKMVDGPHGPVRFRRSEGWCVIPRKAWRRGIDFLMFTASRHGCLPPTRWVPPEYEPKDGLPLPVRPWIEVLDDRVLYHRDGEARHDGNKRRRGNRIPTAFEPQVRAWYEEDRAAGHEFVFHRRDGARYGGRSLGRATFKRIVEDAAVEMARVPHHFKDLFVQLADEAGMERDVAAAHADTTAKTLGRKYGEPVRTAFLDRAAEELDEKAWRERARRKAEAAAGFGRGSAAR